MKKYRIVFHADCGACRYFIRHYVRRRPHLYLPMDYGHCIKKRVRRRQADEHCTDWTSKLPASLLSFLPKTLQTYHPPKFRGTERAETGLF